jgi:hypothetical protein
MGEAVGTYLGRLKIMAYPSGQALNCEFGRSLAELGDALCGLLHSFLFIKKGLVGSLSSHVLRYVTMTSGCLVCTDPVGIGEHPRPRLLFTIFLL